MKYKPAPPNYCTKLLKLCIPDPNLCSSEPNLIFIIYLRGGLNINGRAGVIQLQTHEGLTLLQSYGGTITLLSDPTAHRLAFFGL